MRDIRQIISGKRSSYPDDSLRSAALNLEWAKDTVARNGL